MVDLSQLAEQVRTDLAVATAERKALQRAAGKLAALAMRPHVGCSYFADVTTCDCGARDHNVEVNAVVAELAQDIS